MTLSTIFQLYIMAASFIGGKRRWPHCTWTIL